MKKKILIGCIVAVAVLIGVSFTSVVGHRSVANDVKASPLFNIRTSRAIDEESEELSCAYIGKGDNINLLIPKIDSKTAIIQEVIDRISKMDDETYDRFIGLVIGYINRNNIDSEEIVNELAQLKGNQDNNNIIDWPGWDDNRRLSTNYPCTLRAWLPGCFIIVGLFGILYWAYILTYWIVAALLGLFTINIIGGCCHTS